MPLQLYWLMRYCWQSNNWSVFSVISVIQCVGNIWWMRESNVVTQPLAHIGACCISHSCCKGKKNPLLSFSLVNCCGCFCYWVSIDLFFANTQRQHRGCNHWSEIPIVTISVLLISSFPLLTNLVTLLTHLSVLNNPQNGFLETVTYNKELNICL